MKLAKESTSVRPTLVASALAKRAIKSFTYIALLMSFHTDMLCGLLYEENTENFFAIG
jgi:hypothetical protein